MDPAIVFCPKLECPARGQAGQGNIRLHSRKDQRFLCTACQKTFTAAKGTALYRLRTPAETVSLVGTRLAPGGPLQAIVVACGFDERTVASWGARAGGHGQAVQAHLVEHPRDLGPVQGDELRVKTPGGRVGMALAMMVRTRLWLAGEVSTHRDLPLMQRLIERGRRCATHRPRLCCTAGFVAYVRAIRETCRDPEQTGAHGRPRRRPGRQVCIAQVVKRAAPRRRGAVARRVIAGTPARVETLQRRSPGGGVLTTAYSERLNATFRERLASLTRRGRALARRTLTLPHRMYVIGTLYHCCTPHTSLRLAAPVVGGRAVQRTPAMATGITEHCWTVQEWLSFHVPPPRWTPPKPRGRPSRALQCLIARWCS
jgi:transposase-like protein